MHVKPQGNATEAFPKPTSAESLFSHSQPVNISWSIITACPTVAFPSVSFPCVIPAGTCLCQPAYGKIAFLLSFHLSFKS